LKWILGYFLTMIPMWVLVVQPKVTSFIWAIGWWPKPIRKQVLQNFVAWHVLMSWLLCMSVANSTSFVCVGTKEMERERERKKKRKKKPYLYTHMHTSF
jgi:hypothetical protein